MNLLNCQALLYFSWNIPIKIVHTLLLSDSLNIFKDYFYAWKNWNDFNLSERSELHIEFWFSDDIISSVNWHSKINKNAIFFTILARKQFCISVVFFFCVILTLRCSRDFYFFSPPSMQFMGHQNALWKIIPKNIVLMHWEGLKIPYHNCLIIIMLKFNSFEKKFFRNSKI